jgi:hypothetical protein
LYFAFDVVQQRHQLDGLPPLVFRTLWRHDDEWELLARRDEFRRAMDFDKFQIVAALAPTVQEQQQRP